MLLNLKELKREFDNTCRFFQAARGGGADMRDEI